jgi:uncharacterized protein YcfL
MAKYLVIALTMVLVAGCSDDGENSSTRKQQQSAVDAAREKHKITSHYKVNDVINVRSTYRFETDEVICYESVADNSSANSISCHWKQPTP